MPLLPAYALAVKNFTLTGQFSQEDDQFRQSEWHTAATGWYGPFMLRGSYATSSQSRNFDSSWNSFQLSSPQPQIIGFLSKVLPLCPNPDPSLSWERRTEALRNSGGRDALLGEEYRKMLAERHLVEQALREADRTMEAEERIIQARSQEARLSALRRANQSFLSRPVRIIGFRDLNE